MTDQRDIAGIRFPAGFVWGAATSAFQIEGAARTDGKGESIWDRYCAVPGHVKDGATGEVACDHYHRWQEDVALMARLGLSAYRFSVAWSRVLPEGTGRPNRAGLDFYDRLVDGLLEHGIEPWLTLYHWDLPQALEDAGGWPDRRTARAFGDYAAIVSERLGDRVRHWMTVNEPWEIGFLGYHEGIHAPGRTSLKDALAAIHTVLLAHGLAVEAIRANAADPRVGIAIDLVACYPDRDIPADVSAAWRLDGYFNRWFLDPLTGRGYPDDMVDAYGEAAPVVEGSDLALIATPLDFVGLNYYYSHWAGSGAGPSSIEQLLELTIRPPHTGDTTGMGWAVHPAGLEGSLARLARAFPGRDLVVTESGAAYDDRIEDGEIDDKARIAYHAAYLEAVARAVTAGAPVRGYFAWSLLDNLEWSEGFAPRFGLVAVDRDTLQRTVKASGAWYRDVIAANGFG